MRIEERLVCEKGFFIGHVVLTPSSSKTACCVKYFSLPLKAELSFAIDYSIVMSTHSYPGESPSPSSLEEPRFLFLPIVIF